MGVKKAVITGVFCLTLAITGATAQDGFFISDKNKLRVQYRNCVFESLATAFNSTDHSVVHLLNPNAIAETGFQACVTEERALIAEIQATLNNPQLVEQAVLRVRLDIKEEIRRAFAGAIYQMQRMRQGLQ